MGTENPARRNPADGARGSVLDILHGPEHVVAHGEVGAPAVPQAQERWQQKGQAVCQATQLPLTLDGETAGQVSLWELGVSVTPETAAQLVYDAGAEIFN